MVMPKKRASGSKPKIKRISHQYIKNRAKKKIESQQETQKTVQPQSTQQQGSYGVQAAQQPVQNQQLIHPVNPVQTPVQQPVTPVKTPGWVEILIYVFIVFVIVYTLTNLAFSNSGGSLSGCPTTCSGPAIVIPPSCNCPGSSHLSTSTPYIRGGQYDGYKQCVC